MGISVIGILVSAVVLVGTLTVIVSTISRLFRRGDGSAPRPARGVTLNCPHCGEQTEAACRQCEHCSREL